MPGTVRRALGGQPIWSSQPNETGTHGTPILQLQIQDTERFNKLLEIRQLGRESPGSHLGRPASEPPYILILTTYPQTVPSRRHSERNYLRTYGKKRSKRLIQNYVGIKTRGRTKRLSLFWWLALNKFILPCLCSMHIRHLCLQAPRWAEGYKK